MFYKAVLTFWKIEAVSLLLLLAKANLESDLLFILQQHQSTHNFQIITFGNLLLHY